MNYWYMHTIQHNSGVGNILTKDSTLTITPTKGVNRILNVHVEHLSERFSNSKWHGIQFICLKRIKSQVIPSQICT